MIRQLQVWISVKSAHNKLHEQKIKRNINNCYYDDDRIKAMCALGISVRNDEWEKKTSKIKWIAQIDCFVTWQ